MALGLHKFGQLEKFAEDNGYTQYATQNGKGTRIGYAMSKVTEAVRNPDITIHVLLDGLDWSNRNWQEKFQTAVNQGYSNPHFYDGNATNWEMMTLDQAVGKGLRPASSVIYQNS